MGTPDGFYEDIDIIYWDLEDSSGPDPPINSFNESNVDNEQLEEWEHSQLWYLGHQMVVMRKSTLLLKK
jgi:hypothetical protein